MAERLEYSGDSLPSGLPGFGGGTVNILVLPGFNRVVAPQKFGPVNDAPTVTPPSPEPPPGSNPENPTNEVVTPAPAPSPNNGASANFCEKCVPPESDAYENPLLFGRPVPSSCQDCTGATPGTITWFDTVSNGNDGIFLYQGVQGLQGRGSSNWKIDASQSRATLYLDDGQISFIQAGGPLLIGPDGNDYRPEDLEVCEGGQTKIWKVLAYKPS